MTAATGGQLIGWSGTTDLTVQVLPARPDRFVLTLHSSLDAPVQSVELRPSSVGALVVAVMEWLDSIDTGRDPVWSAQVKARAFHVQEFRTVELGWGCRCGWVQDRPHREHVADMIAAAVAGAERAVAS